MSKSYAVVEVFATLQGEGVQAGRAAVFVRFGGCNLWSGHDQDRERDHQRHGSPCILFCDTDFRQSAKMTAAEIVHAMSKVASDSKMPSIPLVVLTGGEPLLQVDRELLEAIKRETSAEIAVETNGTTAGKPGVLDGLDWICVSPKKPASDIVIRKGNELKVVFPDYDPLDFVELARGFAHQVVQPVATTHAVGESSLDPEVMHRASEFCRRHPQWRLSVQTHKVVGLP